MKRYSNEKVTNINVECNCLEDARSYVQIVRGSLHIKYNLHIWIHSW